MSDAELVLHVSGHAGATGAGALAELTRRGTVATHRLADETAAAAAASTRYNTTLVGLTWALVGLTVVIVGLTVLLLVLA